MKVIWGCRFVSDETIYRFMEGIYFRNLAVREFLDFSIHVVPFLPAHLQDTIFDRLWERMEAIIMRKKRQTLRR